MLLPVVLAFAGLVGCCLPKEAFVQRTTLSAQETVNWCWAATTEMLAETFGIPVEQCELANERLSDAVTYGISPPECCDPDPSHPCRMNPACAMAGIPMLAERGLDYSRTYSALGKGDLKRQIARNEAPLGYGYGDEIKNIDHVVVINGYMGSNGILYLTILDPLDVCTGENRTITYEEYKGLTAEYIHLDTWYNLKKSQGGMP